MNLQEEKEYLQSGLHHLQNAADKLLKKIDYYSENYHDSAKYIWENQSEFDEYEAIFNQLLLDQVVDSGQQTKEKLYQIIKMMDSPYFSRIDFMMEEDLEPMKVYIGKFSFWDDKGEYEVFDWRAPISGMYYEFEPGKAYYDAPMGRIEGELVCKRQYKIRKGILEYALESGIGIRDEILQQEFAQNADHKMKDIVTTIQKEQNKLIRDTLSDVLIIQGVAGSGKTSIALHRIAYFLYRYKGEITSKDFLIISPNGVFVDYIADVLPELGEENVNSVTMDELAEKILCKRFPCEKIAMQAERYLQNMDDARWVERNRFKSSDVFLEQLNDYLDQCNKENFVAEDYNYDGGVVEAAYIQKCYDIRKELPVRERFMDIADLISTNIREVKKNELFEWLMFKFKNNDVMLLYQDFYVTIGKEDFFYYRDDIKIESADIFPLMYLKIYLEGFVRESEIKYLIIDEMQDYTPIQFAVINKLYHCRKTILGDFYQNVIPFVQNNLNFFREIYPKAQMMEITKSYRSTYEIMDYARHIKNCVKIDPIERHGGRPAEIAFKDRAAENIFIINEMIKSKEDRRNGNLGIICKSCIQARELYEALSHEIASMGQDIDFNLFTYDTEIFYDSVVITSVSLSKGLEFGEVLIVDADHFNYCTEYDRDLLYVACTRAMNDLKLLYCEEKSIFLEKSGGVSYE